MQNESAASTIINNGQTTGEDELADFSTNRRVLLLFYPNPTHTANADGGCGITMARARRSSVRLIIVHTTLLLLLVR